MLELGHPRQTAQLLGTQGHRTTCVWRADCHIRLCNGCTVTAYQFDGDLHKTPHSCSVTAVPPPHKDTQPKNRDKRRPRLKDVGRKFQRRGEAGGK